MQGPAHNVSLHVTERGVHHPGSVLVFLHYFGGSSGAWSGVMDTLAYHYRCCALDLAGFGASPPLAGDFTVDDMATHVATTIAELRIASYTLAGHSMGAKIAWVPAARHPVGLESLALLAPAPPIAEPIPDEERARLLGGSGSGQAAEETAFKVVARRLSVADHHSVVDDSLRNIPGAHMKVLPGAGHLLPLEAPVETAGLIAAHRAAHVP